MTTLRDAIQSDSPRPVFDPIVNARHIASEVAEAHTAHSLNQVNSQCTLVLPDQLSGVEEGQPAEAWGGYNGLYAQLFSGQVVGINWDYAPTKISLDCRDILGRTTLPWGGPDRVYTSQDDAAVIRNLLEAVGITRHYIESSAWTLGELQDVVLKTGDTPWSLIQRIDILAGYRTFGGPDGMIYRRRISGAPGLTAAWSFQQGVDIISVRRVRSLDNIFNKAIVRGFEYQGVVVAGEASAVNPYLDALVAPELRPWFITKEIQDDLVETDAKALEIAQRFVGDLNRRPESLEVTTVGNPLIWPGVTVSVTSDEIEAGTAFAFVEDVRHDGAGASFITSFKTGAGTLSGYNASAPVAQFSVLVVRESDVSGSPAAFYEVIADSTSSFDPDGPEDAMTRLWAVSVDAGTATVIDGLTGVVLRFFVTGAATEATVTLTLTDQDGLTGSSTQVVPINEATALLEDLYSAEGTIVAAGAEDPWAEQTVPGGALATCLMDRAPAWGMPYGANDGHVYASFDKLATALVDLGQPDGANPVTAIWVHELYNTRIWTGHADGTVSFGLLDLDAQTVTWSVRGSVNGGPVTDIAESYGQLDELRAMSDNTASISRDGGSSWTVVHTGDTAWRQTAGWERQFSGFLNDAAPLREEIGNDVTLPMLSPVIEHIRGLALGWRQRELYLADDQARLLRSEDLLTAAHTGTAHAGVNHMIRSGNVDGVVYLAVGDGTGFNGVEKSMRMEGTPIKIRDTGTRKVYMVGYGGTHPPAPPPPTATIYWPTDGVSPGGVWKHDIATGIWTLHNTGLPSGFYWYAIAASPLDANKLLLLGNTTGNRNLWSISGGYVRTATGGYTPLYLSEDAGLTWTGVDLPATGITDVPNMESVAWSKTDPDHWCVVARVDLSGGARPGAWLTGTLFIPGTLFGTSGNCRMVAGADDQFVIFTGSPFGYVTHAGVWTKINDADLSGTNGVTTPDDWPGTTRAVMAPTGTGHVFGSIDYRGAGLTGRTGGVYDSLQKPAGSVGADGVLFLVNASGLLRVTNFFGAPAIETVGAAAAPGGTTVVRTDRQTRARVVARAGNDVLYSPDGATGWVLITGPGGTLAYTMEVTG